MIYCIWYPCGGFGHYLARVLSLHGDNFLRPDVVESNFSNTGDSHGFTLSAPKYLNDPDRYDHNFDPDKHHVVLVDNGIDDASLKFMQVFKDCCVIKVCYDDQSWPILAQTLIIKALGNALESEVCPDPTRWSNPNDAWAIREKYFLYLRDHPFRDRWNKTDHLISIDIADLWQYNTLLETLNLTGIKLSDFSTLHQQWQQANSRYFDSVSTARDVMTSLKDQTVKQLDTVKDTWTQAVINYFIWLHYGIEIPANDHSNWFTNTLDIHDALSTI